MKILEYLELNSNKNDLYHTGNQTKLYLVEHLHVQKKKKKRLKLNTVSIKPNKLEKSTIN